MSYPFITSAINLTYLPCFTLHIQPGPLLVRQKYILFLCLASMLPPPTIFFYSAACFWFILITKVVYSDYKNSDYSACQVVHWNHLQ